MIFLDISDDPNRLCVLLVKKTLLRHNGFNANRVLFVWTLPYIPLTPEEWQR